MNLIIVLLFAIDIWTIYFFQSRLSIFDLYGFLTTTSWASFSSYISILVGWFIVLCGGAFLLSQRHLKNRRDKKRQLKISSRFFAIAICMSVINFLKYDNKDLVDNILTLNITAIKDMIFPGWFIFGSSATKYENYFKSTNGKNKKLNVILVIAESFSTVDSKRSGGLYDNLPLFDKMQSNWITFTNFMANGCTSATAHIGLFQWIEPRENPLMGNKQAYDKYASMTDSLPDFFNKLNYQTTFISSVSLDFLNEWKFLSGMQFKKIIGEEAFKDKKKYVFGAAPDMDLYNKTLETVQDYQETNKPYFVALQTISSHKPFNTPYGTTPADMFSYTDKTLYAFYQKLKQADFFKDGILVVVWDHRKMESVSSEEFTKRWLTSQSRALATVVWAGIKPDTYNNNIIQHTDIFNSIKYLVGGANITISSLYNNIFNGQRNRDRWVRYCQFAGNAYAVIKQDGQAYKLADNPDKKVNNYINAFKAFEAEKLLWITWFTGYHVPSIQTWNNEEKKSPILIAHAGWPYDSGLFDAPATFKRAKADWADGIEFDVSYTKDKQNVIMHWPTLYTTICDKDKKEVKDYTLKELQTKCPLKNKEKIPTLEAFLRSNKWLFDYYFLEIKVYDPSKAEEQTLDAINTVIKLWMEDEVIFISYDKIANYIIWSHKRIRAWRDGYSSTDQNLVPDFPHEFYLLDQSYVNSGTMWIAKSMNKQFITYTINTREAYEKMRSYWVDRMMTDSIPLLKTLRANE